MRREQSTLIGLAIGGTILTVGALIWFWIRGAGADEEGIRVKSGSVKIDTVSGKGFEVDPGGKKKFKTKKKAKGAIHIAAWGGTCAGEFFVPNVTRVVITADNVGIELIDSGEFAPSDTEFKKSTNDLVLERAGGDITKIEAFDASGLNQPVLSCTSTSGTLEAYLHISK